MRHGFTLIELLVSISIVSVFVALAASPVRDAGRMYLRARADATRLVSILLVTDLISRDVRASSRILRVGSSDIHLCQRADAEISWRFAEGEAYRKADGEEEVRFSFPAEDLALAIDSDAAHARHLVMRYRVGESGHEERGFSLRIMPRP